MATGGPVKELCEELTCSICLDYFNDPVTIAECGHNFCRGCLAQCWGESEGEASCPLCKGTTQLRSLGPNRQLANVVQIAKKFSLQGRKGGEATQEGDEDKICEKHREPLKLFCQTDQVLVCVVCDRSKEHKTHEVIPAGEAFEEYKDKIFRNLESLKTEREKILAYLAEAEKESQEMLKTAESERQKMVAEFRKLHQFLEEQENRLLAHVEEVEKEVARRRDEHLARLSEELSSLESLIREVEEKHRQPETELLQDVRSTLQRCEQKEDLENPVAFPPELKWKLQGCCDISPCLGGVIKQFQDTLVSVPPQMQKANVTLDPTTASNELILSEDRRSIKFQRDAQDVPGQPFVNFWMVLNFSFRSVLGCEGFTGGCHFWEVSVGCEECWAVGVAKKPVRDRVSFSPSQGIWAVGRSRGIFKAFTDGLGHSLPVSEELKRIRVCLNCEGGRVAFFDADAGTLLYTFSGVAFSGETLYPFFAVQDKGHLRVSSSDS